MKDLSRRGFCFGIYPLLILMLLFFSVAGCTGLRPVDQPGAEKVDFMPDPALVRGQLPNGFKYVLMKNREPQNRVSMHLDIQAGSIHEADGQQGVAHYLEHMLFNGSTHFKPGELIRYFQRIGMNFGGDANAHTGYYETVYDVVLPSGEKKNLEEGLLVLRDYADGALLLEEETDRERNVILAEKRDRDSTAYRMFVSALKFELPHMRLTGRQPIGEEEIIKTADSALLREFYHTWYRPEKMVLVMVGDFDPEIAAKLIKEKFSSLVARAGSQPDPDPGFIDHKGTRAFHYFDRESGKTSVAIEVLSKEERREDSPQLRRETLVRDLGFMILNNRLERLTGMPDTPFTGASTGAAVFLRHVKYAHISAECTPEKWEETLAFLDKALRAAFRFPFTELELARVRLEYLATLESAVKSAPTRNSNALARSLIRSINKDRLFLSPEQEMALLAPVLKSVTVEDVHGAFREVWSPEHRLVLVTGNAPLTGSMAPEEQILTVYEESRKVESEKPVDEAAVVFPYLPVPSRLGKITKREWIEDLGVTLLEFENGVRLNLKKTDFKADQVLFRLSFGRGRSAEPEERPGLAVLSESVINESGLGRYDRDEIQRALAGKNTEIHFGEGEESFYFSGSSVTGETELMFQLIQTAVVDPVFRPDAWALVMERMAQSYRELERTVDGAAILHGQKFLAGGDSRFGLPSYEELRTITLDDMREYIVPPLSGGALELSVVGDFDEERVIEDCARYLGALDRKKSPVNFRDRKPRFPDGERFELEIDTEIPKGLVMVAYPTVDYWNISETRRLAVLGSVFSERLREGVREKLGAAYSPYAYNRPGRAYPGYGTFQAVVSVDPDQTGIVEQEVKKISAGLVESRITEDELKRAIDPILTSIRDMRRTNAYWLNSVLSGSLKHPCRLEWSRSFLDDYSAVTADDMWAFAKKYLDNGRAAVVVVKPAGLGLGKK